MGAYNHVDRRRQNERMRIRTINTYRTCFRSTTKNNPISGCDSMCHTHHSKTIRIHTHTQSTTQLIDILICIQEVSNWDAMPKQKVVSPVAQQSEVFSPCLSHCVVLRAIQKQAPRGLVILAWRPFWKTRGCKNMTPPPFLATTQKHFFLASLEKSRLFIVVQQTIIYTRQTAENHLSTAFQFETPFILVLVINMHETLYTIRFCKTSKFYSFYGILKIKKLSFRIYQTNRSK